MQTPFLIFSGLEATCVKPTFLYSFYSTKDPTGRVQFSEHFSFHLLYGPQNADLFPLRIS